MWTLAERCCRDSGIETYTQALMDLGATVCTRDAGVRACPVRRACVARKTGRIAELPAPRPRKALPQRKRPLVRAASMRGKVLLERRPSPGIWGGLWCFPEQRPAGWRRAMRSSRRSSTASRTSGCASSRSLRGCTGSRRFDDAGGGYGSMLARGARSRRAERR